MAYTLTYAQLVAEAKLIVDSQNTEFDGELPVIIARAQDQVQRDLDLDMWSTYQSTNFTAGSATFVRDASWLVVKSWYIASENRHLEQRSLDYVRAYGTVQGVPKFYAERSDGLFQVAPVPLNNYSSEVQVLTKLTALSGSNTTNWISTNAADLLLLATLIGCESFLTGPEKMQEFAQLYQTLLASTLNQLRPSGRTEYTPTRSAARPV